MNPKIDEIVSRCMRDMAERYSLNLNGGISRDTLLFGESGLLDSVGLVSLIVAIEQEIENDLGVSIVLADERAMSQKHSPFRSIGALADYAATLVAAEQ
jgi:acyl carrier protein